MLSFLFGVERTQKVDTAFYFLVEVLEIGGKNVTLSFQNKRGLMVGDQIQNGLFYETRLSYRSIKLTGPLYQLA
jgi:hypothetical protein